MKPTVHEGMKAEFIGEFYWTEEVPKWDEEKEEYIDDTELVKRIVPWTVTKDIYQQMRAFAEKIEAK